MSEIAIATYQASPIKRHRSTKAEKRRNALWDIVKGMKPMTVRQVFYQASVLSIVEKTEAGYNKVQTDLVHMRRAGELPYAWLADNTRGSASPTPTAVSRRRSRIRRAYIARPYGPMRTPMSRYGSRRTLWPASCSPSPALTMYR